MLPSSTFQQGRQEEGFGQAALPCNCEFGGEKKRNPPKYTHGTCEAMEAAKRGFEE